MAAQPGDVGLLGSVLVRQHSHPISIAIVRSLPSLLTLKVQENETAAAL